MNKMQVCQIVFFIRSTMDMKPFLVVIELHSKRKLSTGKCLTPTQLLICSSFGRENGHLLLICSSLSTSQSINQSIQTTINGCSALSIFQGPFIQETFLPTRQRGRLPVFQSQFLLLGRAVQSSGKIILKHCQDRKYVYPTRTISH